MDKDKQAQGDSYTFTVKDKNGYEGLYTLRERPNEKFIERVVLTSDQLELLGFEPVVRYRGGVKPAGTPTTTDEKCNKCGADMLVSQKGNKYCSKKCWLEKTY